MQIARLGWNGLMVAWLVSVMSRTVPEFTRAQEASRRVFSPLAAQFAQQDAQTAAVGMAVSLVIVMMVWLLGLGILRLAWGR